MLKDLNDAVALVGELPRVRFESNLGPDVVNWIDKKHADGAVHEPGTIAAFLAVSQHFKVDCVFDCGALFGYFTILSQIIFPEADVTAFECHPAAAPILSKNIGPSASYFHGAVTDECRKGVRFWLSGFNMFEEPPGGWGELDKVPGAMKDRGINNRGRGWARADFITLDAFCEATGLDPDLIKIDVEAYQAKAIAGAMGMIRRKRPCIVIELHDPEKIARLGITNKSTVQPLFDLGYRGYWCSNFRDKDATFSEVTEMGPEHERLSIMLFVPGEPWTG